MSEVFDGPHMAQVKQGQGEKRWCFHMQVTGEVVSSIFLFVARFDFYLTRQVHPLLHVQMLMNAVMRVFLPMNVHPPDVATTFNKRFFSTPRTYCLITSKERRSPRALTRWSQAVSGDPISYRTVPLN